MYTYLFKIVRYASLKYFWYNVNDLVTFLGNP